MKKSFKAIRSGTARTDREGDRGHIVHLVDSNDYPSWSTALCGIQPRGNGWYYPDQNNDVTCEKCIKKSNNHE
jgi:hypothetical protein